MTDKIQIVVLGESGVGKTSLVSQFVDTEFDKGHVPTIGIDYKQKVVSRSREVRTQIWDTAGSERYRAISAIYYRNVEGVLLVYDITDLASFEAVDYWYNELADKTDLTRVAILLVGNKLDSASRREVSTDQALAYARKYGLGYIETDAHNHSLTVTAFHRIIDMTLKKKKKTIRQNIRKGQNRF